MAPLRVLFVCTGNTCRSSLAEGLMKSLLDGLGPESGPGRGRIEVLSAGTAAYTGDPASPHAVEAAAEMGIDLSAHRSRRLSLELLDTADLVLTMTSAHKRAVLAAFPELEGRVLTLKEAAGSAAGGPGSDISDPFGGSLEVYRRTAAEIEKYLRQILPKLKDLGPRERKKTE